MMRCLAACLLLVGTAAGAQSVHPYAAPAGFTAQSTLHQSDGVQAQLFPTGAGANWHIAMMGEPIDPGPAREVQGGSAGQAPSHGWSWAEPWGGGTVRQTPEGWSETLFYNGEDAACTTPSGDIDEHDIEMGPNPNAISAQYGSSAHFPTLAQFATLNITGKITVVSAHPSPGVAPCGNTTPHAGMDVVVILTDVAARQMVWYQLELGCVNFGGPGCPLTNAVQFWDGANAMTSAGANYAETDALMTFGVAPLTTPGTLKFNVDILPHLLAFIANGVGQIDPDPAHWKMDGISLEDQHWNRLDLVVSYQDFDPSWTLK